jgi:methylated-DNA-[protein]-cysteine S-methyltransferase
MAGKDGPKQVPRSEASLMPEAVRLSNSMPGFRPRGPGAGCELAPVPASTSFALMIHVLFPTAFGTCGMAWNDAGLVGFQLPEASDERTEQALIGKAGSEPLAGPLPGWVQDTVTRVQQHLTGMLQDFTDARLDWSRVSNFQRAVYEHSLGIKPGYKKSYGEIARLMGLGNEAARAVGVALATNPWPLIVPCHRIVSAGDKMTGFSAPGGVRTKTRLLVLEGAELLSE